MKQILYLFIFLFLISCKSLFEVESSDKDIFNLSIDHNILRITDSALIKLTWESISIEDFSHFRIERRTYLDTNWTFIEDLSNPLLTTYNDYIYDDEDIHYRVGIMDINSNVLWSESSITIPNTTTLYIPIESVSPHEAFISNLIDNNDTIIVTEGFYNDGLSMIGKKVYIKSINNSEIGFSSRIVINDGELNGFTIQNQQTLQNGGGIHISGNGKVKNCLIINNESREKLARMKPKGGK